MFVFAYRCVFPRNRNYHRVDYAVFGLHELDEQTTFFLYIFQGPMREAKLIITIIVIVGGGSGGRGILDKSFLPGKRFKTLSAKFNDARARSYSALFFIFLCYQIIILLLLLLLALYVRIRISFIIYR